MTKERDDILSKLTELDKFYELLDKRMSQMETVLSNTNKLINKNTEKTESLKEKIIGLEKDVQFLRGSVDKLKTEYEKDMDKIWEIGIRGSKKELLSTIQDKIDKKALSERVALYGAVIAALLSLIKSFL